MPEPTHRSRSTNSAPRSVSSVLSILSSSTVTMALLPVTVVFLPPRRKASLRYRVSLPTTLPKPRRKPTSLPTTAWRWMPDGTKSFCVWRLSLCRRRTLTRSSPALTKKNYQNFLMTASKPKRMTLMWMPNCKNRPFQNRAMYGHLADTDSSAATVQKRKPTPLSWTAARRTSLLPTRPTM